MLTTCRISGTSSIFFERTVMDVLENLTKEQLIDYIRIMAKNMSALDGVWFQSLEKKKGMDDAMAQSETLGDCVKILIFAS